MRHLRTFADIIELRRLVSKHSKRSLFKRASIMFLIHGVEIYRSFELITYIRTCADILNMGCQISKPSRRLLFLDSASIVRDKGGLEPDAMCLLQAVLKVTCAEIVLTCQRSETETQRKVSLAARRHGQFVTATVNQHQCGRADVAALMSDTIP